MDTKIKVFGINIQILVVILLIFVILQTVLLFIAINRINLMNKKYKTIMSGKKGMDLEKIIRARFKEMDQVKANEKRLNKEQREVNAKLSTCISKLGLVRYDAFKDMTGKISFALAMLDENNNGIVINSMHSKKGYCYTYAKEIFRGGSMTPLTEEEKGAIQEAKTVEDEIRELTANVINQNQKADDDLFMTE